MWESVCEFVVSFVPNWSRFSSLCITRPNCLFVEQLFWRPHRVWDSWLIEGLTVHVLSYDHRGLCYDVYLWPDCVRAFREVVLLLVSTVSWFVIRCSRVNSSTSTNKTLNLMNSMLDGNYFSKSSGSIQINSIGSQPYDFT